MPLSTLPHQELLNNPLTACQDSEVRLTIAICRVRDTGVDRDHAKVTCIRRLQSGDQNLLSAQKLDPIPNVLLLAI